MSTYHPNEDIRLALPNRVEVAPGRFVYRSIRGAVGRLYRAGYPTIGDL